MVGRRRAPRVARLLAVTTLALLAGFAGGAAGNAAADNTGSQSADTAYVLSDVHCSRGGDGVLDLTMVNDSPDTGVQFEVDGHDAATSVAVLVAPRSAHALAFAAMPDGEVDVPVRIDGELQVVHAVVDCDLPRLTSRLSAEAVQGSAPVVTPELPRTGGDSTGFVIGGLLVAAGITAALLARRRYS